MLCGLCRQYAGHVRVHFLTNLAIAGGLVLLQSFGAGRCVFFVAQSRRGRLYCLLLSETWSVALMISAICHILPLLTGKALYRVRLTCINGCAARLSLMQHLVVSPRQTGLNFCCLV